MSANATTKRQDFSFDAPAANTVQLVGDFTHWQRDPIGMHRQADGLWKISVRLAPGTYHYRFLVDGEWRDDPECTLRVKNVFGSEDSVLVVSASHN
jgi:1,4-alpha-glucan branching enzyme